MPPLQESKLAFIGGGNMASAIIKGLAAQGINKQNITVSEPWDVNRNKLAGEGVRTTTANVEAGAQADLVVIAVKPQVAQSVCGELGAAWSLRAQLPVVVSIAAGVTLGSLREWSRTSDGRTPHVVRVMPNTPALLGEGASGIYASDDVTADEKELVNSLLGSVSKATEWVDKEELLDVVTGLSGELFLHRQCARCRETGDLWQQDRARRTSSPWSSIWSPVRRPSGCRRTRPLVWRRRLVWAPARCSSSRRIALRSCARMSPVRTGRPMRRSRRSSRRASGKLWTAR